MGLCFVSILVGILGLLYNTAVNAGESKGGHTSLFIRKRIFNFPSFQNVCFILFVTCYVKYRMLFLGRFFSVNWDFFFLFVDILIVPFEYVGGS